MPSMKAYIAAGVVVLGVSSGAAMGQSPAAPAGPVFHQWALTPPMGWNSWDAFGSSVREAQVLANADYMEKHLKSHGWNLITIDIQWYEPNAQKNQYRPGAILEMDANGRLLPAPNRFPMTRDTRSFKPIADYLHAKGLKFGLHLMRGIPRQAVDQNVPILGTNVRAADVADKANACRWNPDMYGVDMSKPGSQEYYDSVFALMASWDLDFVKVDDLAGKRPEIEAIRKAIDRSGRPIVLSVSMGSPASQGDHLQANANLWRISRDFWDRWEALYSQFTNLNDHQPFQGPGHWPDADMLPFGHVRTWLEPATYGGFTKDEQYTVMTLWSMARSPLIMGGNMPENDQFTLALMTNDEVIAVNQKSTNNRQLFNARNQVAWVADVPGSRDKYVALFNTLPAPVPGAARGGPGPGPGAPAGPGAPNNVPAPAAAPAPAPAPVDPKELLPVNISVPLADIGLTGPCKVRDLWAHKDLGTVGTTISATVNSHGTVLYRVSPVK